MSMPMASTKSETQPKLIIGDINQMDNRSAMGLPKGYKDLRFSGISETINKLTHYSKNELTERMNNTTLEMEERYASGQLLALIGDPRINTTNPIMVTIEGGSVEIGLEPNKVAAVVDQYQSVGVLAEWIEKETPRFKTEINSFRIAKFPITHQEYRDFLIDNPQEEIPSSWQFGRYPAQLANHPVHTISELSADAYCQWLSSKTGRQFRLPSEIEWEYAASGPQGFEYPWGNLYLSNHANTAEFGLFATTPVGLFSEGASPFGILDLAGNIEEYTANNYWAYPGGEYIADDLIKQHHHYRIARGGSYTRFADLARCRRRHGRYNKDIYVMGFRLAEDI